MFRSRSIPQPIGLICSLVVFAICLGTQAQLSGNVQQADRHLQPRALLESHLKSFPLHDNGESDNYNAQREQRIRRWFSDAGCNPLDLSEQSVQGSGNRSLYRENDLPPNVICVLPAETSSQAIDSKTIDGKTTNPNDEIIVGAHTDKVRAGDGVIDNWSGAVLLPALFSALAAQPRHHTFIFIGFSAEERGLVGSHYFADHLTDAQRARIAAVVNLDSLAAGPTEFWPSGADKILLDPLISISVATHLPIRGMSVPKGASADSESFARYHIPRITLHSMTDQTWHILHSPSDKLKAVNFDDYYDSYQLIAAYLMRLDTVLDPRSTNRKIVESEAPQK